MTSINTPAQHTNTQQPDLPTPASFKPQPDLSQKSQNGAGRSPLKLSPTNKASSNTGSGNNLLLDGAPPEQSQKFYEAYSTELKGALAQGVPFATAKNWAMMAGNSTLGNFPSTVPPKIPENLTGAPPDQSKNYYIAYGAAYDNAIKQGATVEAAEQAGVVAGDAVIEHGG